MNTQQLIREEAERRNPVEFDQFGNDVNRYERKEFIAGATFGASLNGWVSVKDRLPTEEDADEFKEIQVFTEHGSYVRFYNNGWSSEITHWRKIVKP